MSPQQDYILQVRGLTKTFSGVTALNNVQLNVRKGEVHALMGENGAGKSTFMKILMGLLKPDSGEILVDGERLQATRVHDVMKKGIAMIHQEILQVPELTVAQNIFLGREISQGWGWLNERAIHEQAEKILTHMGVSIDARTKMKYLSVAEMQMVEIARAISNDAKVIIMDEPTSAIADREVATLFAIIRELTRKGVAIIYISHKMDEIFDIADTITVLRDGNYIGTDSARDITSTELINRMVGREIDSLFPERSASAGAVVLSVQNLSRAGKFSAISFDVRAGEILGVAGLMGAGRTEIARAIYGLDPVDSGQVFINGEPVQITSPQEAIRNGIGYVSEDRKGVGLVPTLSVKDNVTLASLPSHASGPFIRPRKEVDAATGIVRDLRVKTTGIHQKVAYLSGGNQQKVVIGKVLLSSPSVIILDEPTRGIDIGAKAEIYKLIHQLTSTGLAVIMISSELPELVGMSDRVLVVAKGQQTAILSKEEATPEAIMAYAMPQ